MTVLENAFLLSVLEISYEQCIGCEMFFLCFSAGAKKKSLGTTASDHKRKGILGCIFLKKKKYI